MAKRSGASHSLAALVALVGSELLRRAISLAVGPGELRAAVGVVADLLTVEGLVYAREGTVEALLLAVLVVAVTFAWGYLYHVRRHGRG